METKKSYIIEGCANPIKVIFPQWKKFIFIEHFIITKKGSTKVWNPKEKYYLAWKSEFAANSTDFLFFGVDMQPNQKIIGSYHGSNHEFHEDPFFCFSPSKCIPIQSDLFHAEIVDEKNNLLKLDEKGLSYSLAVSFD